MGTPFGDQDGETYCQTCLISKARAPAGVRTGAYAPGAAAAPERSAGGAMLGARAPGVGTKDRCPKCEQPVYMGPDKVRVGRAYGRVCGPLPRSCVALTHAGPRGAWARRPCPPSQTSGPMNSTWHKRCLVCVGCRKPLDSMAVLRDTNKVYCSSCARKA